MPAARTQLNTSSEQRFAALMIVLSVIIFVAVRRAERRDSGPPVP